MTEQAIRRDIDASPPHMNRQSAHQPGQAIGDAGGSDGLLQRARLRCPASSHADLASELEQRARGLGEIVVERRACRA